MPKVAVFNIEGKEVGEIELNDAVFGVEVNETLLHEVVVNQLANRRQGTVATKTRGLVRGGGRKPWRQKGTGRARHGSTRSPIWVGGGTTFGPNPRDYSIRIPRKLKRVALKSALTSKVNNNEIFVLNQLHMEQPKTNEISALLEKLNVKGKVVLVTADSNPAVYKSTRNIPGVSTNVASSLNTYEVLNSDTLILTQEAVAKIEEVFA